MIAACGTGALWFLSVVRHNATPVPSDVCQQLDFPFRWVTTTSQSWTVNDQLAISDDDAFAKCIKATADAFVKYDYQEAKDLSKAFSTLLTATLVASITFSEKIVDLRTAGWWAKGMMVASWAAVLLAISMCGVGLVYATGAGWTATHQPQLNYLR
jgi:hypothetical protein